LLDGLAEAISLYPQTAYAIELYASYAPP
jgi:hypothetical protein